jgi:hypothetical protein
VVGEDFGGKAMTDKTDPDTLFPKDMENSATISARRRLLRAGLGSGAVLMTIKTRSALACTSHTCTYGATTPSAFGSMNMSPGHIQPSGCMGKNPEYWKNNSWPNGYRKGGSGTGRRHVPATKFGDYFTGAADELKDKTFFNVLSLSGTPENEMARDLVTAVLNAASGKTSSVLSVEKVQGIWQEYVARRYYEPVAGIKWYPKSTLPATNNPEHNQGIVGYLQSTYN